jgi:hypothetical protein
VTSIAVVSSCTGSAFWKFLPAWAHAVAGVTRAPDEVVVVTDAPPGVRAEVETVIDVRWVEPNRPWEHHPAYQVNDAIAETTSDWIAKLDVDDLALPGYLTGVDGCDADVWCVGYRLNGQDHVIPTWPANVILAAENNLLASCSPFRRWLWEADEWPDSVYDDWCFWLHAAKLAAKFESSQSVGYEYRQHPDQTTRHADLAWAHRQVSDARC